MLKTMIAVEDFFGPLQLLQGDRVRLCYELKDHIYNDAAQFRRGSPTLEIYFVTGGVWKDDVNLNALINQHRDKLIATGLFSSVKFVPVDATKIQALYFRTKNAVRQTVAFEKSVTLPPIGGVTEAHIGVLPGKEYLKLISDDQGGIRKQLFFDNMRDFMEDSDTNKEIAETLQSNSRSEFPLRARPETG